MRKLLVLVALLLAACGNGSTDTDTAIATSTPAATGGSAQKCEERTLPSPSPATDTTTKPKVEIPAGAPPCKLVIHDLKVGTGAEVKPGGSVTAHYVGVSWSTKEQFDSSWDRGQPIPFSLGGVIQGWQQGIPGMKEGGRRQLIIPPDLGYGDQSQPGIPAGETLVFVVDLVKAA
jgi:peptidylprolyl isomerase